MTTHSPFDAEQGAQARDTMLRLLAATGGAAGDFAGEVVAGRRQPHELLTHGPVLDEFVEEARGWWQLIDALLAEQRHRLAADAWTSLEQQVDPEIHRVLTEKVFPRQANVITIDEWVTAIR